MQTNGVFTKLMVCKHFSLSGNSCANAKSPVLLICQQSTIEKSSLTRHGLGNHMDDDVFYEELVTVFAVQVFTAYIYVIIYVYSKHKLQINQEYLTKLRFVAPVVSFVILANQEHLTKLRFVAPLLSLVIFAILSFFQ